LQSKDFLSVAGLPPGNADRRETIPIELLWIIS
jgi:hypothetical protein